MDYSQLPNDEINRRIARLRGYDVRDVDGKPWVFFGRAMRMPCNDWAGCHSQADDLFAYLPREMMPEEYRQEPHPPPRVVAEAWLRWQESLPEAEQWPNRYKRKKG